MVDERVAPGSAGPCGSADMGSTAPALPVSAADLREANENLVLAAMHARSDVMSARLALDELVRTSSLDSLTQLPTRALLLDRFSQAIQTAKRHGGHAAVLFVDIDSFKLINDTLGHVMGDKALQLVARCIVASIREVDTVSRYGGDEFVVLLPEITAEMDALLVADKVMRALGTPSHLAGRALSFTASVGISFYPTDGEDAETLIDCADAAMYQAKRRGGGGMCIYRDVPAEDRSPKAAEATPVLRPLRHGEPSLREHGHTDLQEANEQLVVAALTAQELQSAAEQAYRRQNEFLAVLAHELRHPLAPIRTAVELVGRVGAEELPRIQAMMERQVKQMVRIVDDLLDLGRVSTGKLTLDLSMIDMVDVIRAAVAAGSPAMGARQQHFVMHNLPDTLPLSGDSLRLEQVVRNLLDNASKYTPKGGTIQLSAVVVERTLVITVSDSGIGITAEALPSVFEPFVQDRQAMAFEGAGLGIGLTVARQLVEAHGGQIMAQSGGSGMGSQFIVLLPLHRLP